MKAAFSQHRNPPTDQTTANTNNATSTGSNSSNSSSAGGAPGATATATAVAVGGGNFQPPYPRSQQQQQGSGTYQQPPPPQGYPVQHHHHHHHQHRGGGGGGHHHHHHHGANRSGFSGNNNNNYHNQQQQHGGNTGGGGGLRRNGNSNSNLDGDDKPTGTTGMQIDFSANVEVYAHGQDTIYTIPRADIKFIPPPLENETAAGATQNPQQQGNNNNNQQQQQKLQLCPNYNIENPEDSCPLGANCRFVHADTKNATTHDIHCNYAYANAAECRYETYPAGEMLHVAPPNSNAATDEVPSHLILKTRALQSNRRTISHCAHYYFNRVCNRGPECFFVHAISLAPNEGNNNNSGGASSPNAPNGTTGEDTMYRRIWGRTQNRNRGMNQHGSLNSLPGRTPTPPPTGGFPRNESHGSLYNDTAAATSNPYSVTPPRGHTPTDSQFPTALSANHLGGGLENTAIPTGVGANNNVNAAPPSYTNATNVNPNSTTSNINSNATSPNKYGQQQQGTALVGGRTTPPPFQQTVVANPSAQSASSGGRKDSQSPNRGMKKSPSASNMVNAFGNANNNANAAVVASPDSPQKSEFRRMNDPYSKDSNARYVRSPVSRSPSDAFGPTPSQ